MTKDRFLTYVAILSSTLVVCTVALSARVFTEWDRLTSEQALGRGLLLTLLWGLVIFGKPAAETLVEYMAKAEVYDIKRRVEDRYLDIVEKEDA